MMQTKNMRLPTCEEWNRLAEVTNGGNGKMHWAGIYSWCQDSDFAGARMVRGCHSDRYLCRTDETERRPSVGFRPVFEIASPNEIPDGTIAPIATLYMGNRPIKVPNNPICVGDIPEYVPGSGLEFLPTVENPDNQIQAIKVGDVLIADRNLVYLISWENLHEQGFC